METTTKCEKCGWRGIERLIATHTCDRKVQEKRNRDFWAIVERDLDRRSTGR
jgi:C4-type Zn-finger protein